MGGPIHRDRAFFFGSFEKLDEARGVNIDRSKIAAFALEGLGTPSGAEDFTIGPNTNDFVGMSRFDFTLNDPNHLYLMWSRSSEEVKGEISSPIAGTIALPSAARSEQRKSNAFTLREMWTISSTSFLETSVKFIDGDNGLNVGRTERLEPVLLLLRSGFLQTYSPFGGKNERDLDRSHLAQSLSRFQTSRTGDHLFKLGWDWSRIGLNGFNEVTNDVEYSAAFLSSSQAKLMGASFRQLGFQQAAARFFTLSGNPDAGLNLHMSNNDASFFLQDDWRLRSDLTLSLGLRYDYASLFAEDKNNFAPRLGFAWDVAGAHRTVLRGSFGLFYDRNLLSAAATVPELGGVFTRSAFDVALPRLGFNYTDSLIDLVITSGFPLPEGVRTPPENSAYRPFADALRTDRFTLYKLLNIAVPDPLNPPVINADNIQALSGLSAQGTIHLLESTFPDTDWEFFDVPGGSIVGDRVLSFFPRGPLDLTRDLSRFSEARTPWTRAFSLGLEHQLTTNIVLSVNYVHRRSRDLLTRRIVNLFDVSPGDPNFGKTLDPGPRINQVTYEGKIDYDGVVFQLLKRFNSWYTFNAAYTGSRSRDNLLTGNVASRFTNNNHPEFDYGPSNQSAPHIFVANGLFSLPLARIIHQRRKKRLTEPGFTTKDAVTGCWEVCSAEIGRWEVENGVFGTQHSRRQLRNRVFGPSWAAKWGEVCPRRARRSLAQGMRS